MSHRSLVVARLTLERWALTTRLRIDLWRMRAEIGWGLVCIACTRIRIGWLIRRGKLPPNALRVLDQQARYRRAIERQRTNKRTDTGGQQ